MSKEKEIKETTAETVETTETTEKAKSKKNLKKLKFGSVSAITIALVIAVVIAANIVCSLLTQRYPMKLDLTTDNRFEISEESIEALKSIDKDVEIIVTTSKDYFTAMGTSYEQMFYQYYGAIVECPYDIIPEILDKYSVYAEAGKGGVDVKYVDINKNPDVVTEINKYYTGEIKEGGIVVKCGERVKFITPDEVVSMVTPSQHSTQNNIVMTFTGESVLTSAVKSVADANLVKVAFVSKVNGGGVLDQTHASVASSLMSFLNKNGYECAEVDLGADSLEEYDTIAVVAPAVDFTADTITKLSDFLYNNGEYEKDMIYIPNLFVTNLPNITEFLADWKIQFEPAVILDEETAVQASVAAFGQVAYVPAVNIADKEITGTLSNETLPLIAPDSRAITVLNKNNETIVKEVIKSAGTSYLTPLTEDAEVSEEKGEYNIVVKARKEASEGLNVFGSNILVIGSPFMLDSAVLAGTNTYNNANVMLNIINETTGKEAGAVIPEKSFDQYVLSISQNSARVVMVVVIVVIPLLIGIAGLCVLLWRKNK